MDDLKRKNAEKPKPNKHKENNFKINDEYLKEYGREKIKFNENPDIFRLISDEKYTKIKR